MNNGRDSVDRGAAGWQAGISGSSSVATRRVPLPPLPPHVQYQIEVYNEWLKDAGQALFPSIQCRDDLKRSGILNCVTPAEAVDLIGAYVEATNIERYYCWTVPPGYPLERMNEHLALFADEVMPHFRPG